MKMSAAERYFLDLPPEAPAPQIQPKPKKPSLRAGLLRTVARNVFMLAINFVIGYQVIGAGLTGIHHGLSGPNVKAPPIAGFEIKNGFDPFSEGAGRFDHDKTQYTDYQRRRGDLNAQIEACRKDGKAFNPRFAAWVDLIDAAKKLKEKDPILAIKLVNGWVNSCINFDDEKEEKASTSENWIHWDATPQETLEKGKEVCAGYTLLKMETLKQIGFDAQKIHYFDVGYIQSEKVGDKIVQKEIPHAVVLVEAEGKKWVLNSQTHHPDNSYKSADDKYTIPAVFEENARIETVESFLNRNGSSIVDGNFIPLELLNDQGACVFKAAYTIDVIGRTITWHKDGPDIPKKQIMIRDDESAWRNILGSSSQKFGAIKKVLTASLVLNADVQAHIAAQTGPNEPKKGGGTFAGSLKTSFKY